MSSKNQTTTVESTGEYLRMALPLMSQFKVPVTPQNYAVWYAYVEGENKELITEIKKHQASGDPFTTEVNQRLFQKFAADCDVQHFAKIRAAITEMLKDVGESLLSASSDTENYGGTLDHAVKEANRCSGLDDIRNLLEVLVDETRNMQRSNELLHEHFESRYQEIELLQEELERERKRATIDPLTKLSNRLELFNRLENCTADEHDKQYHPLSLLMIDIDHFKKVNDNYGHLIGDRVIRYVAQILKQHTKGQDTAARYGGEEFAVLLPATGIKGAKVLADTICKAIAETPLVRSDTKESLGQITVSIGVSIYHQGEDIMEFINRADQALYTSKHAGRNRVTVEGSVCGVSRAAD